MKLSVVIASGQGLIPVLVAMVLLPNALSVTSLVISIFKKTAARSLPAIILASVGCASGLLLLCLTGLPKSTNWMDLTVFFQFPVGFVALIVSLRRRKKDT
jgi:hypothetical protein